MKIVKMIIVVVTAIGTVLLPRLSIYRSEGNAEGCNRVVNNVLLFLIFIFMPAGIGIISISHRLVPLLFGEAFIPAVSTLRITALLIYALGFSNLFGTQVLLSFDGEKKLLFCTLIGAVSNICMNLMLIPRFQQNGAAVASVTSEAIVTIMTFVFSRKYIKYKLPPKFIPSVFISTINVLIYVMIINTLVKTHLLNIVISIIGSVIIYIIINYLMKNPIFDLLRCIIHKEKI